MPVGQFFQGIQGGLDHHQPAIYEPNATGSTTQPPARKSQLQWWDRQVRHPSIRHGSYLEIWRNLKVEVLLRAAGNKSCSSTLWTSTAKQHMNHCVHEGKKFSSRAPWELWRLMLRSCLLREKGSIHTFPSGANHTGGAETQGRRRSSTICIKIMWCNSKRWKFNKTKIHQQQQLWRELWVCPEPTVERSSLMTYLSQTPEPPNAVLGTMKRRMPPDQFKMISDKFLSANKDANLVLSRGINLNQQAAMMGELSTPTINWAHLRGKTSKSKAVIVPSPVSPNLPSSEPVAVAQATQVVEPINPSWQLHL